MYTAVVELKERGEEQMRSELQDILRQARTSEAAYQGELARLVEQNEELDG